MLTPEQKERLEDLRTKDSLNEDEKKELAELEALEPEDPAQDEFDDAFDNDNWDDDASDADDDQDEGELTEDRPEEGDSEDDSIFDQTPDEDSDHDQDSEDEDGTLQEETPEQKIARLEAENAKMSQRMSSWEGRLSAADRRANEAEQKLKKAEGKGSKSDADTSPDGDKAEAELSAFIQEFPDLERPIRILIHKEAESLLDARLGPVEESVTKVKDTLKVSADERHFAEIGKAHPDWEKIVESGALQTWIDRQPKFLQPRLNEICQSGETQEVIEMFDQYKKATGKAKSTTTSSRTQSKKKKAQSIEAVPASSGGPKRKPQVPDKDDFDGSWDHWNKKEKE